MKSQFEQMRADYKQTHWPMLHECLDEIAQLEAEIERLREEAARLIPFVEFAKEIVQVTAFMGLDLGGEQVQERAKAVGVLVEYAAEKPCGELCSCAEVSAFPQTCYRFSDAALPPPAATKPLMVNPSSPESEPHEYCPDCRGVCGAAPAATKEGERS